MEFDVSKLKQAGRIAAAVRRSAEKLVKPGARASEICGKLESMIVELGGMPAFPCNISIDEVAAHYTPSVDDDVVVGEKALVKIDVGVHVDGHIADTATTIDLSGEHQDLVEASERALEAAISVIKPFVSVFEIGRAVESEARRAGFKPIKNLSGHSIGRFVLHSGISIPNHADRALFSVRIAPGTLIAVEPFVTNGRGYTVEKNVVNIFSLSGRKGIVADETENLILSTIASRYKTLPFTPRWLLDLSVEPQRLLSAIRSLYSRGVLRGYPVLVEAGGGLVAQAEHTVYVDENGVLVTTE
ncbi:MAG: type II methionyl aminopeptidase [Acidilobaceae archaeon]